MTAAIDRHSRGVFVIAATPFTEGGALDLDSIDTLVDFYLGHGASGLTILGIMGEAPKLDAAESVAFVERVLARVESRVPVIVGVSAAGDDVLARLSHRAMEAGAAGVMVAPQRGLNTEAAIRRYFAGVCAALGPDVPVCLQDYPQTTGVHFSVDTILALAEENRQIVMLKHEDWPGLNKLSAVRAGSGNGAVPRLSILVGNGGLFLPEELARGADGAMTGFAYPEMLVEVVRRHAAGDVDGAATLFDAYLPLVRYEQQLGLGLAVRKAILHRRGAIASPRVRAPGPALTPADEAEITRLIDRLDTRLEELRRWTSD